MDMLFSKRKLAMAVLAGLLAMACVSKAPPLPPEPAPQPVQPHPVQPFDPSTITAAEKQATMTDVRSFIEDMNSIIQNQDFEAWYGHLTQDYIDYYSSPEVLFQISESPVLKRQGVVLRSLKDYFINVVYRSRQNGRVDDIEFVGENLVKAITIGPNGERQILYYLEKTGSTWKIGIGR